MAVCPKCKRKLRLFDWRQNCPNCGVNLMFFGFEERFYTDAKYAELSLAKARIKLLKIKTALIGGKLQIARLALIILPIIAVMLPIGRLSVSFPLFTRSFSVSGPGLYIALTDGTFSLLGSLKNALIISETVKALQYSYYSFACVCAIAAIMIICELLCFISIKKMSVILCTVSMLGVTGAVFSIFSFNLLAEAAAKTGTFVTAEKGFGGYAVIAAFLIIFILNTIIAKKGLLMEYKEGDLYRVEIAQKLKRGEIMIDDIPQPVYETEQERAERKENAFLYADSGGEGN